MALQGKLAADILLQLPDFHGLKLFKVKVFFYVAGIGVDDFDHVFEIVLGKAFDILGELFFLSQSGGSDFEVILGLSLGGSFIDGRF